MLSSKKSRALFILFIIHLGMYLRLLLSSDVNTFDFINVIDPLFKINSLQGLIDAYKFGELLDVAPLKEFSHLIDIWVYKTFKVNIIIAHNYFIFFITIYLSYLFFQTEFPKKISLVLISIMSFHPLMVNVVYIGTWRKHWLSYMFTLVFLYLFQSTKMKRLRMSKIVVSQVLAILSFPVNIGIPFWAFVKSIYEGEKIKTWLKSNWYVFVIPFLLGLFNVWYYASKFVVDSGSKKFVEKTFVVKLLSLGRWFYQIVIPVEYVTYYDSVSLENSVGLLLLVIIFYISYKVLERKHFILGWLLFFLNYFLLNLKSTPNFLYDSYLLLSLTGILYLIGGYLKSSKKNYSLLFSFIISVCATKSYYEILIRDDLNNYSKISYLREQTCPGTFSYLKTLIKKEELNEFKNIGEIWLRNKCRWSSKNTSETTHKILNYLLLLNDKIPLENKLKFIQNEKSKSEHQLFLMIILYLENNNNVMALEKLEELISRKKKDALRTGILSDSIFSKKFREICLNFDENESAVCKRYRNIIE